MLDKIPPEIRNKIYRYLLLNPLLGTYEALGDPIYPADPHACGVQYELFPAILRTCRQISTEALVVLYGENTFFVEWLVCPLSIVLNLLFE